MNPPANEASEAVGDQSRRPPQLGDLQRYGLAVLAVGIALAAALVLERFHFRDAAVPLLLFANAISAWMGGTGPAVLAFFLSAMGFDYFFVLPVYSLYVDPSDLPYFIIFAWFAALCSWFSTVRRRVEQDLARRTAELEAANRQLEAEATERKRREDEVRDLNHELAKRSAALEASNKELEAFAYSISHDLRAPLRHMAGFAELLRTTSANVLNEKSQRYLTMILDAANRMGSLIDDLLAFSRIGRAEAHKSLVSLDQLAREAVAEAQQDAKERKIVWKINALPTSYGDRSMLRVALVNLVSNAVKFTRTRAEAEIEIGCSEKNGDHVVLFVRDNGVGFDMRYSNKLFGVFQRLHSQEAFEGTGIGLATVERIVHRHGGRVWAEGVVDGGAIFYFSLSEIAGSR